MNRKGWFSRLAFVSLAAGGALLTFEACTEPVGKMLVDAGTALADAGTELMRDAGVALNEAGTNMREGGADAAAQPAMLPAWQSKSGTRIEMRLKVTSGADGSRRVASSPTFFDKELGEACNVLMTVDGKMRCVPNAQNVSAFADADCHKPLGAIANTTSFCPSDAPTPAPKYIRLLGTRCEYGIRFFPFGPEHVGDIYKLDQGQPPWPDPAKCLPTTRAVATTYYNVGEEIPPSSFVEFTEADDIVLE